MRVQDINGRWYEVDDALLVNCEVKAEREPAEAKSPSGTAPSEGQPEVRALRPAAGSTAVPGSPDSALC
ncbi:MAG: hypothetical protein JO069_15155 [Verrucomicrobia bacterium]|nr:hypothetical protein [Verrucomicrobiota bacterium]